MRLRVEFDAFRQASNTLANLSDLGVNNNQVLRSALEGLIQMWLGNAGKAFASWWQGAGQMRARWVEEEMESLLRKVNQIEGAVRNLDETMASRFQI